MIREIPTGRPWLPAAMILLLLGAALPAGAVDDEECLACHEGLTDDDDQPVAPDLEKHPESLHGSMGLSCVDCHADLAEFEGFHEDELEPADCSGCHADAADAMLAGSHRDQLCSSCHGAHDILAIDDPDSPAAR